MVATGVTVLAFTFVLAFALFIGWALLRFVSFASPALTPVIAGLFLALLFKPYYGWFLMRVRNPTIAFVLMLTSVLVPLSLACWFGGSMVAEQISHLIKSAPTIITRASDWVNQHYPNAQSLLSQLGANPDDLQLMFLTDPARFSRDVIAEFGSTWGASAVKAGFGFLKYLMGLVSWLVALLFFAYFLTRPAMKGCDYVKHLPFLKEVKANAVTGSILFTYEAAEANEEEMDKLAAALRERVFKVSLPPAPPAPPKGELPSEAYAGAITRSLRGTMRAFSAWIKERSGGWLDISSAASLFFLVRGFWKMMANQQYPTGSQMFWWAVSLMRGWRTV